MLFNKHLAWIFRGCDGAATYTIAASVNGSCSSNHAEEFRNEAAMTYPVVSSGSPADVNLPVIFAVHMADILDIPTHGPR